MKSSPYHTFLLFAAATYSITFDCLMGVVNSLVLQCFGVPKHMLDLSCCQLLLERLLQNIGIAGSGSVVCFGTDKRDTSCGRT